MQGNPCRSLDLRAQRRRWLVVGSEMFARKTLTLGRRTCRQGKQGSGGVISRVSFLSFWAWDLRTEESEDRVDYRVWQVGTA